MSLLRGFRATRYIFWEMLPSFFLGVFVFIFILLMFQALRLTEFILIHGVGLATIGKIAGYLSIAFLPAIFPMALLFSVLLTYGRLSSDSEILAMRALGLNSWHILSPALILGILIAGVSAQTSFNLAPWGNRQFELLISHLGASQPDLAIREGTFSEDFFNLVIYAGKVDSKSHLLKKVFIYDERNPKMPLTIVAREGSISDTQSSSAVTASLELKNGSINRTDQGQHTKIDFKTYDLNLYNPISFETKKKSLQSLTMDDIRNLLRQPNLKPARRLQLETEKQQRWAISVACLLFALLGAGLGIVTNRRNVRSGNLAICIGLIALYWVLYIVSQTVATQGLLAPAIAMWFPNVLFAIASGWSHLRN